MPDTLDEYGALASYIETNLSVDAYTAMEPEQTTPLQRVLPYIAFEGKFTEEYDFENNWENEGDIEVNCMAVGDEAARALGLRVRNLFGKSETWQTIPTTGFNFIEASIRGIELRPEENVDQDGQPVYRYQVTLHVKTNGAYT